MIPRCPALALFLVLAALLPGDDQLAPEILLLAHIRTAARQSLSQIPAYACQETVERFSRSSPRRNFRRIDGFQVQVAEIGNRELFARPGDKQFQDKPLSQLVKPGMVATGVFSILANAVFLDQATKFEYHGEEKKMGHKAVRYDFQVAQLFSAYQIVSNGYRARVAMVGSFWADPATYDVLELEVHGVEIPPQLRMRGTSTVIRYNSPRIEEHRYLIPSSAVITSIGDNGSEDQNRTDFRDCHKYIGESKITF